MTTRTIHFSAHTPLSLRGNATLFHQDDHVKIVEIGKGLAMVTNLATCRQTIYQDGKEVGESYGA